MNFSRGTFMLGFSLAVGLLLAVVVVAVAAEGRDNPSQASSSPRATPATELGVFRDARRSADVLPPSAAVVAQQLLTGADSVSPELRPGAVEIGESRLLATGRAGARLYAFPTSAGKVCYVIIGGSTGCRETVTRSPLGIGMFDPDRISAGTPMTVYGILGDDVRTVEVRVDGTNHAVPLGRNAFLYRLPESDSVAEAVTVTFTDGEVVIEALPAPPGN